MNPTSEMYVTITGFKHYYGPTPFRIGKLLHCEKEADNHYDVEAIRCYSPEIGTLGYVAASYSCMAQGTMSAGRIYDRVPDKFFVRVRFITQTKVICQVVQATEEDWKRELFIDNPPTTAY